MHTRFGLDRDIRDRFGSNEADNATWSRGFKGMGDRAVNGLAQIPLLAHMFSLSQDRGNDAPGGVHAGRL
jgi:hypothetical protein